MSRLVGMFGAKCSEKGFHFSIKIIEKLNKDFYLCKANVSIYEPIPAEYVIYNIEEISKFRLYRNYFKFNDFIRKVK